MGFWRLAGGRSTAPTVGDYEAALVPLTELLFTEAQLPKGAEAEQRIQADLRRLGHFAATAGAPGRELARLSRPAHPRLRGTPEVHTPTANYVLARVVEPGASVLPSVTAYARVCRNLGWDRDAHWFVFAHTHQPLEGVSASATQTGPRFWNTGCWIYEPPGGSPTDYLGYLDHNWPGSAVVIDTEQRGGEPQLLELLAADRQALRERFADRTRGARADAPLRGRAPPPRVSADRSTAPRGQGTGFRTPESRGRTVPVFWPPRGV